MAKEVKSVAGPSWPSGIRLPLVLTFEHQSGEGTPPKAGDRPNALMGGQIEYGARTGEAYQIADDLQDRVPLAPEAPPTPEQLALLAPALWHFCGETDLSGPGAALQAAGLRAPLRKGMVAAIEARLAQAVAAAQPLTSGPWQDLLRTAPRDIVRAMWAGAP